jgi:hypothetical protein
MPPLVQIPMNLIFCGTLSIIIAFTRDLHWSLSWVSSIQSIAPNVTSVWAISIIPTHLFLGLTSGLFPYCFLTSILYAMPCMLHSLSILSSSTWSPGEEYKLWSSTLCGVLQHPHTSPLFWTNIFLDTLFSALTYVPRSMTDTMFRQVSLYSHYYCCYYYHYYHHH